MTTRLRDNGSSKELYACTEIDNPAFDVDEGYDTTTTNDIHLIDPSQPRVTPVYKEQLQNPAYAHKVTFTRVTCTCRRVITFVVAIVAVVAVAIAIYFIVQAASKEKTTVTGRDSNSVTGSLKIVNVDYLDAYADPESTEYITFAKNVSSKLTAVIVASSLKQSFVLTTISGFTRGSIIVNFEYLFNKVFKADELEYNVEQEFFTHTKSNKDWSVDLGGFIVERKSIHFKALPLSKDAAGQTTSVITPLMTSHVTTQITTPRPSCRPVSPLTCRDPDQVSYHLAAFPNILGQRAEQAEIAFERERHLATSGCYRYAARFLCAVYWPQCGAEQTAIPPCNELCEAFFSACSSYLTTSELTGIICANFPLESTAKCVNIPVVPPLPVRLVDGGSSTEGRVEVYVNGGWGFVCDTGWSELEAIVVCRQLNYTGKAKERVSGYFGAGSDAIAMADVHCSGSEHHLASCKHTRSDMATCPFGKQAGVTCNYIEPTTKVTTTSTTTRPPELAVRLVGGPNSQRGRVEMSYYGGPWGTICRNMFRVTAAEVLCRYMGFSTEHAQYEYSRYGPGVGDIWLTNVHCVGTEPNILLCKHDPWGQTEDCTHLDDVSISCDDMTSPSTTGIVTQPTMTTTITTTEQPTTAPSVDETTTTAKETTTTTTTTATATPAVQTTSGSDDYRVRLVGPSESEGRVEILYNDTWGTICAERFGNDDAAVICRMLGQTGNARVLVRNPLGATGPIWLTNVSCSGEERTLSECGHNPWGQHHCDHYEDVYITCDAPDSPMRLTGGRDKTEGLVEIFYNNTWGSICGDEFDERDAKTVCRSLGFTGNEGAYLQNRFGQGTGPIWLESLRCLGDELHVTDCRHDGWGVHNCDHTEDVSVTCAPSSVECQPITVPMCARHISWNMTSLPNVFGHKTQKEATDDSYAWTGHMSLSCHPALHEFLCALYTPPCMPGQQQGHTSLKPCRALCFELQERCKGILAEHYPELLDCNSFPDGVAGVDCMLVKERHVTHAHDDVTTPQVVVSSIHTSPSTRQITKESSVVTSARGIRPTTQPLTTSSGVDRQHTDGTKSASTDQSCEQITIAKCRDHTLYNYTHLPNSFGHMQQSDAEAAAENSGVWAAERIGCHDNTKDLICAVILPKCTVDEKGIHIWKPCYDFCEEVRMKCEPFLKAFHVKWPINCENFPRNQQCFKP